MNTERLAILKRTFNLLCVFAALACTAASCNKRHSAGALEPVVSRAHCGFADPVAMTSLGICYIAADYYAANCEWPLTGAQLQEHFTKLLEADRAQISADEMKSDSEFFNCFTLLDLRKSGQDLVMHYRFSVERKNVDQTVTLRPRQTADEILEAAATKGYK